MKWILTKFNLSTEHLQLPWRKNKSNQPFKSQKNLFLCVHVRENAATHTAYLCVCLCVCVCESVWVYVRAGIPFSNWVQLFNVSQSILARAVHDASKLPLLLSPSSCPLCALYFTHPASSLWFETCRFFIQAFLSAFCFTVHFIGSLVVDIISVRLTLSLLSSDWHAAGLMLPSVQETWWGVCIFHLYFIQRNIFLSSLDLQRPGGLLKAFNCHF